MGIMSLKYDLHDIVCVTPEFGSRTFIIYELVQNGYLAIDVKTKKRYPINDSQISFKIDKSNSDNPLLSLDHFNEDDARCFCQNMRLANPNQAEKWGILENLIPGAPLKLIHRKAIYSGTFVKINFDKPAYPIRAKIKGLVHDFRLDSLV